MDKLTMAHEWAMKSIEMGWGSSESDRAKFAWQYADAMQAEADKRKEKGVPEVILKASNSTQLEWQPDWDKIPDGFNWWAMDKNSKAHCFDKEPVIGSTEWFMASPNTNYQSSLNFGYQGYWRNSLRKRPEMEAERHG